MKEEFSTTHLGFCYFPGVKSEELLQLSESQLLPQEDGSSSTFLIRIIYLYHFLSCIIFMFHGTTSSSSLFLTEHLDSLRYSLNTC